MELKELKLPFVISHQQRNSSLKHSTLAMLAHFSLILLHPNGQSPYVSAFRHLASEHQLSDRQVRLPHDLRLSLRLRLALHLLHALHGPFSSISA